MLMWSTWLQMEEREESEPFRSQGLFKHEGGATAPTQGTFQSSKAFSRTD